MDSGNYYDLSCRINKLFVSFGFMILLYSSQLAFMYKHSFRTFISHPNNIIVMTVIVLLITIKRLNTHLLAYVQILILTTTSIISLLSDYSQFSSIGQVILLIILLYKYDLLRTHFIMKLTGIFLCYIAVTEYSLNNSGISSAGIKVYLYVIYFLIFLYILYKAEIDKIIFENHQNFKNQIDSIQSEKEDLIREMKEKEQRIKNLNSLIEIQVLGKCRMNMETYHLTKAEKKIVHLLAARNLTNKDIAANLNIREGTVKSHLYHVYNKIGVSTRNELLGLYYSINLDT